jgi:septal ring factor EnvC (AmiA/AmiB activator)
MNASRSASRHHRAIALLVLGSAACGLPGCAQPTPFQQRNALIASLRDSVSALESKNQKLDRRVADLSTENRRLEDRLVEEEAHNRELARRLDDARVAASGDSELAERSSAIRRTQPAARGSSSRTPFAQIHGEIQPYEDARDDSQRSRKPAPRDPSGETELFPSADADDALQGRRDDRQTRWLFATKPDSGSAIR